MKQLAIFVADEDTRSGVDHVDGTPAPVEIVSSYAERGVVDDHHYNQLTVLPTASSAKFWAQGPDLQERDTKPSRVS